MKLPQVKNRQLCSACQIFFRCLWIHVFEDQTG